MPRKSKIDLTEKDANKQLLQEIYNDAFSVVLISSNIMRAVSSNMDYTNKEEVFKMLPLIHKQQDILNEANQIKSNVEARLSIR